MSFSHVWYASRVVVCAVHLGNIGLLSACAEFIEGEFVMAKPSDFSDDERQLLVTALDMAIASAERAAKAPRNAGGVAAEFNKVAARYAALKGSIVMTR